MHIKRGPDNSIMEYAEWEFPGSVPAEGNIVRTMTGVWLDTDQIPAPPVDNLRRVRLAEIAQAYEAALVATLTMPRAAPSATETSTQAALFAAEDPHGLADVITILAARQAELEVEVNVAETAEDLLAVIVTFPV